MERELTFPQAAVCFLLSCVLFLLAAALCSMERGGY